MHYHELFSLSIVGSTRKWARRAFVHCKEEGSPTSNINPKILPMSFEHCSNIAQSTMVASTKKSKFLSHQKFNFDVEIIRINSTQMLTTCILIHLIVFHPRSQKLHKFAAPICRAFAEWRRSFTQSFVLNFKLSLENFHAEFQRKQTARFCMCSLLYAKLRDNNPWRNFIIFFRLAWRLRVRVTMSLVNAN